MKYLGQTFKQLREARHISLAKASGEQFSQNLKAEKMISLLKNYLLHLKILTLKSMNSFT